MPRLLLKVMAGFALVMQILSAQSDYADKEVCKVCTCSKEDVTCTDSSAETLPEKVFAGLKVLGDMRISMDKLTKLSVRQFEDLTVGGTFSIDGCGSVSELPAKLFAGATFRSLFLMRTQIKTLPANLFSGCTVHQILKLSENKELETNVVATPTGHLEP